MDNEQLLTFITVYEFNNYSRAAEYLNLTQPAVTARIQKLELELDCKLFYRDGKKILLTEEGNALLPLARKILNYMNEAKHTIELLKSPTLTIGLSPAFSVFIVLDILALIRKQQNKKLFDLIEAMDSIEISNMITKGMIDVGLVRDVIPFNDLEYQFLFHEKLVFVVGKEHPLAHKSEITKADLVGQTMVCYRRETPIWLKIDEKLVGIEDLQRIEVGSFEMLNLMVKNNWGFSIIPELSLGNDPFVINKDYCIIPFPEFDSLSFNVAGIYKKNSPKLDGIQLFLEFFKTTLENRSSN